MRIQSINNQPMMRTNMQTQSTQLKSLIESMNAKAQQKPKSFDTMGLSIEVKRRQRSEAVRKERGIETQSSGFNGTRTAAEWAESSLTSQRNGINSVKDVLKYQKERLEHIASKIEEYEKIAGGEAVTHSTVTSERAAELANRYRESIKTDFSTEIKDMISFYDNWVRSYDEYSGGLASQIMDNVLQSLTAESLGLDHLSGEPSEIIKALEKAEKKLEDMSKMIEDSYFKASGEKMTAPAMSNTDMWESRLELECAFIEMVTVDGNTQTNGQILKMDDNFLDRALTDF